MRAAREALPVSPAPQPTGTARLGRRWRLSSARGRFLGCARPPLLDDTLREPHRETVDRDAKSDDTDRFRVVSRHSNRRATARGGTAKGCLGHCYLGRADIRGGAMSLRAAKKIQGKLVNAKRANLFDRNVLRYKTEISRPSSYHTQGVRSLPRWAHLSAVILSPVLAVTSGYQCTFPTSISCPRASGPMTAAWCPRGE